MAWTAPRTWVTGEVVTSSIMNTHVRDNFSVLNATPVTTLPASPVNGDYATLVDSVTAPTWVWHLRYDTGISDSYKWIFLGGSPKSLYEGSTILSSGSAAAYATVTAPRAGYYHQQVAVNMNWNATQTGYVNAEGASSIRIAEGNAASSGEYHTYSGFVRYASAVSAGQNMFVYVAISATGAVTIPYKTNAIWPVRLS